MQPVPPYAVISIRSIDPTFAGSDRPAFVVVIAQWESEKGRHTRFIRECANEEEAKLAALEEISKLGKPI